MDSAGERLKQERIRLGYSVRKFAKEAGVATSTQSLYESNGRQPRSDYYNRISALGAEIFWIMSGDKEDDAVRDKRAAMYPPEIRELIEDYKLCPDEVKAALRVMAKQAADTKRQAVADFKKKHGGSVVKIEPDTKPPPDDEIVLDLTHSGV